jgi:hypothetical protein
LSVVHAAATSLETPEDGCASVFIAGRLFVSTSTRPASGLVMKSM